MLTGRKISELRRALHRITVQKTHNGEGETSARKRGHPANELQHFRKILLTMRADALANLRDCQDSVRSIESSQASYGPREQPVSFNERSAHAAMQEEYSLLIGRQIKLLGYLDAALMRIDEGMYGLCISCKELIARERLEAVPHTQLCLACKEGGRRSVDPRRAQSGVNRDPCRAA